MTKEPRAHWVLVGLLLLVLLGELCLHGYTSGAGADGPGHVRTTDSAASAIHSSGPVLRLTDTTVNDARMPAKTIALTFDDGPDPTWTPQVLAVLERFHVKATFFEIGSSVDEHPELTRAVVAQGSEVGVHTFTHPDLDDDSRLATQARTDPYRQRHLVRLRHHTAADASAILGNPRCGHRCGPRGDAPGR